MFLLSDSEMVILWMKKWFILRDIENKDANRYSNQTKQTNNPEWKEVQGR